MKLMEAAKCYHFGPDRKCKDLPNDTKTCDFLMLSEFKLVNKT